MITSGSCRRMAAAPRRSVTPACGARAPASPPRSWYSTGSSTVMIFSAAVSRSPSAAYSVVVLPRTRGARDQHHPVRLARPAPPSPPARPPASPARRSRTGRPPRSSRRSTTLSPNMVGTVLTRRSSSRALQAHADAAVLRAAALGDVQLRQQLDAADDRLVQLRRRLGGGAQHAVHAKARREPAAVRLQVDVAGARVVRVADEQVHVADDGRLVGQVADVRGEVVVAVHLRQLDQAVGAGAQPLDQPLHLGGGRGLHAARGGRRRTTARPPRPAARPPRRRRAGCRRGPARAGTAGGAAGTRG